MLYTICFNIGQNEPLQPSNPILQIIHSLASFWQNSLLDAHSVQEMINYIASTLTKSNIPLSLNLINVKDFVYLSIGNVCNVQITPVRHIQFQSYYMKKAFFSKLLYLNSPTEEDCFTINQTYLL